MKYPVLIFYIITSVLLIIGQITYSLVNSQYLLIFYIILLFAQSYYVIQNYDFDHGVPHFTIVVSLLNATILFHLPIVSIFVHAITHTYLYVHIKSKTRRNKRLKYDYTINNLIPGPMLLKVFSAFFNIYIFTLFAFLANIKIYKKFKDADVLFFFKYIILTDLIAVAIIVIAPTNLLVFLVYMSAIIVFDFIEIKK